MSTVDPDNSARREWLGVAVVTAIGLALRLWPFGRLGLEHFDEGVYAFAASWVFDRNGLWSLSPDLISYAPPGYPIVGGLAYAILGRSDGAMIAVSQVAGTLTIPVVAWLGRRTFGPGAGFASAAFCACSGPAIAFSRMGLTDASALLAWLVALGLGMRFLERPDGRRGLLMGLGVGLAQQFKYNGWLSGAIVIGSAVLGIVSNREGRKVGPILKTFGWGLLGAIVAAGVVWPWYRFVEAHGGYAALLRHQRSYLEGWSSWWPNFLTQCDQSWAMLGGGEGATWLAGLGLACLTPWIVRPPAWEELKGGRTIVGRVVLSILYGILPGLFVSTPYWLGLAMAAWLLSWPRPSVRVVGAWWLALTILVPFYHPYARLWLPYQAANWLLMGWLVANGPALMLASRPEPGASEEAIRRHRRRYLHRWAFVVAMLAVGSAVFFETLRRGALPQPDLLAPSDSLRRACDQVSATLPDEVVGLRVLARRPVLYYLAGRVGLGLMADSDQLDEPGDPRVWALVDSAILRSETGDPTLRTLPDRLAGRWEVAEELPTTLNLPTALDVDPSGAVRSGSDRSAPLWLLRPRRPRSFR